MQCIGLQLLFQLHHPFHLCTACAHLFRHCYKRHPSVMLRRPMCRALTGIMMNSSPVARIGGSSPREMPLIVGLPEAAMKLLMPSWSSCYCDSWTEIHIALSIVASFVLGGCTHRLAKGVYIERHNEAVATAGKAIMEGARGGCLAVLAVLMAWMADAGWHGKVAGMTVESRSPSQVLREMSQKACV